MLCSKPYRRGAQEFGCGQCMPCRINKRREWSARIQVEAAAFADSSFATLTYADDKLPPAQSLSRRDYRLFTKGIGYRYFGVGEYGDLGGRPHYHFVLFGCPATVDRMLWLEERWAKGRTHLVPMSRELANYISGYVTKKLRKLDDPRLSPGQAPEFASMSRRPALATWAVSQLAARQSVAAILEKLDVDSSVRVNGKVTELGRTINDKVRKAVGLPDDWKHARGLRQVDYVTKSREYPELIVDREIRRETQQQRAEGLARRRKGSL